MLLTVHYLTLDIYYFVLETLVPIKILKCLLNLALLLHSIRNLLKFSLANLDFSLASLLLDFKPRNFKLSLGRLLFYLALNRILRLFNSQPLKVQAGERLSKSSQVAAFLLERR